MKGLKKLVLASAIAAASSSSFAMQAMDDEALSAATGQDGLTITISTANPITGDLYLHDTDGYALGATDAGAIGIKGFSIDSSAITMVIDAEGDTATNDPYLNIGVSLAAGTVIETGDITVATSNGLGVPVTNETASLIDSMTITLGATDLNIQLGNAPQGAMIALNTTMTGGLSISNFALNDTSVSGGGSISVSAIDVTNAAGGDLDLDVDVSATATGLAIDLNTVGTGGLYVSMTGVGLGSATSIGNVEVIGLNLAGTTVTIAGH